MKSHSSLKRSVFSVIATTLMALAAIGVVAGCSPKPTAEEGAAQTKVVVDQAVAAAKKEMIAEQAAEKDKQEAIAAAKTEEKAKQDEAVAQAVAGERKRFAAEQRATTAANAKKERLAEQRAAAARSHSSNQSSGNASVCAHCGVVLSVNEIDAEGSGSGMGVVAGGVVGGLLGNQVGAGSGRDLATIAGVVGGAFAGNKVEKMAKKTRSYNIVVKMNSGDERTFNQTAVPNVVSGDKVKIENDVVVRR